VASEQSSPSEESANLVTIQAYLQAYNSDPVDDITKMFAEAAELHNFTHGIHGRGREEIGKLTRDSLARFPGRRSECVHALAAGDVVVSENHWVAEGLAVDMCYVFRLANGRIVEQREYG
jgi:hypothetical protein